MSASGIEVTFWGVRGSIPVSGPEYALVGGNTACLEIACGGKSFFIDAGSGIRQPGERVLQERRESVDVFLSHFHYDHVIGIPFFKPIYDPSVEVRIWSGHMAGVMSTHEMLDDLMQPPWFPVPLKRCAANVDARNFKAGDVLQPLDGVVMKTGKLVHPGGCIGFRIEHGGKVVAHISDTEHEPGELDPTVLDLIRDADLVIYDANYLEAEMTRYRGFGHSTWEQGVKLCEAAGARKLVLFHHDARRTDEQVMAIEKDTQARFPNAVAARDRMTIDV